ncbi:MAG: hypothetical protein U1F43_25135 [Myxococcota bacterium]
MPRGKPVLRWRVDLVKGAHVRAIELVQGLLGMKTEVLAARTGLFALRDGVAVDLFDDSVLVAPPRPPEPARRADRGARRGDRPEALELMDADGGLPFDVDTDLDRDLEAEA